MGYKVGYFPESYIHPSTAMRAARLSLVIAAGLLHACSATPVPQVFLQAAPPSGVGGILNGVGSILGSVGSLGGGVLSGVGGLLSRVGTGLGLGVAGLTSGLGAGLAGPFVNSAVIGAPSLPPVGLGLSTVQFPGTPLGPLPSTGLGLNSAPGFGIQSSLPPATGLAPGLASSGVLPF